MVNVIVSESCKMVAIVPLVEPKLYKTVVKVAAMVSKSCSMVAVVISNT